MSLIYTISDTHLSNRKGFAKELQENEFPGTNSRFNEIINTIRRCADQAVNAEAEALVIPGDVFNERGILPVAVYNASYKVFEEISKKIRLIFSPGNHDMVSSVALHGDEGLHSLYGFKEFAEVAHKHEVYETDSFTISMIPFIPSKEGTIEAARALYSRQKKSKKFSIVFFHHSFEGAESGPINWSMPYPLTFEDIPPFDSKFSGHIHKHQTIGPAKNGLVYVGAPLHHDSGERHYKPGWLSIDSQGSYKHIENTFSPRFVLAEVSSLKDLDSLKAEDYKVIRWTGEAEEGQKIRDNTDNVRVEMSPQASGFKSRTQISSADCFEDMAKIYMKSKLGSVDQALLNYGVNAFHGVDNAD
jgi:DNA repair exonuclease SbcCD nuclease subunit